MDPPPPNHNDGGGGYDPLAPPPPNNGHPPPPHHGGYHHPPPPPQQQQQQQHGGIGHDDGGGVGAPPTGLAPPPPHQHPPYGYPPNHQPYNHHGGYTVNYQNYANYPPPPPPPGPPPPGPPGGGGSGGGGHPSQQQQQQQQHHHHHPPPPPPHHHHHQYHPPIAYQYDAAAAAYQYPPAPPGPPPDQQQQQQQMPKATEYHHQYPPPLGLDPQQQPTKQQYQQDASAYDPTPVVVPLQLEQQQQQIQPVQMEEQPPPQVEHEAMQPTPMVAEPAPLEANTEGAVVAETTTDNTTTTTMMGNNEAVEESTATAITDPTPVFGLITTVDEPTATTTVEQQQQISTTDEMAVENDTLPVVDATAAETTTTEEADSSMKETDPDTQKQTTNEINPTKTKIFQFSTVLTTLETYQKENGNVDIPTSHPAFTTIVNALVTEGIEDDVDQLWEENFAKLKEYKSRTGDCDVPFTDNVLGSWVEQQREVYTAKSNSSDASGAGQQRYPSRYERLTALNFSFTPTPWDARLRELMEYKEANGHCSPPVYYPGLGIWVVNQRFNIKDMPKERVAALDSLGFVWNHNRKNRSQGAWDRKYQELLEFMKHNGHVNVPATYRHSPLGTWVGKQREEYKKMKEKKSSQLDKYRIDKLNEVNFQWVLQQWTVISWDDRFEALKKFKEQHGHCKVPRNHPDFGNWPTYQKAQYKLYREGKKSKITKEKVDKLIEIGFLETKDPNLMSTSQLLFSSAEKGGGYDVAAYDWNPGNHQVNL